MKKSGILGTIMKLGTIMPLTIANNLDMGPGQFHPVDELEAILLTPLLETSIFVITL